MVQKNSFLQEAKATLTLDQFLETQRDFTDKLLVKGLSNFKHGRLTVITQEGYCIRSVPKFEGPEALIYVYNKNFIKRVFTRGDIGLGETFIEGEWDTPDLFCFLHLCALNADHMGRFANGHLGQRLIWQIINLIIRRNSRSGSRKNIIAHYDIGNEFYKLWLDSSMTYSSGLYLNEHDTLEQAQQNKYQRIIDQLPQGTRTILEIGVGWGGFAEFASKQGYAVTGITISPAQYEYAQQRVQDKAKILLSDYRDIQGQYDAIVSIEMFEAVGEQYWDNYFHTLKRSLKPNGVAVIQSITVKDSLFEDYRKRNDFIRCYTFPGGMLPSIERFSLAARKANLTTQESFKFGQDYKTTLLKWYDNLSTIRTDIINSKGQEFLKSWQFYLALCAAGFACDRINVVQFTLTHEAKNKA